MTTSTQRAMCEPEWARIRELESENEWLRARLRKARDPAGRLSDAEYARRWRQSQVAAVAIRTLRDAL